MALMEDQLEETLRKLPLKDTQTPSIMQFSKASAWARQVSCLGVLVVLVSLLMATPATGDQDQSNQSQYNRIQHVFSVQSKTDAMKYLDKYGYLNCIVSHLREKRDADSAPLPPFSSWFAQEHDKENLECTSEEIADALKEWQKKYHLKITGVADKETRDFMSKGQFITNPETLWHKSKLRSKQMLDERIEHYIKIPDNPPDRKPNNDMIRSRNKRSSPLQSGTIFNKKVITYRLVSTAYSTHLTEAVQRRILRLAFRMWSEVIPITFQEDVSGDANQVDIKIYFGTAQHQTCEKKFDGKGGEIAHSWSGGDIHFDDDDMESIEDISLLKVAVHEVGHVLGLPHLHRPNSVMYEMYDRAPNHKELELGWQDRKEVQKLYGICKGRFDTVFDFVYKIDKRLSYTMGTYFFREGHHWMYEKKNNRTRHGDPLKINMVWKGVPDKVDGFTQTMHWDGQDWQNRTYFFKGDMYYEFDHDNVTGEIQPKKIADDFASETDSSKRVPDNVDSVFYDTRDDNLYFFKDEWVYVYGPLHNGVKAVRKVKFTEIFPMAAGETDSLTGSVDAVYNSLEDKKMYFLKNEEVYENVHYIAIMSTATSNSLKKDTLWYNKWYDICDV